MLVSRSPRPYRVMNARRIISLIVLVLLLPVIGFATWEGYQGISPPPAPPRHALSKWKFATEEHWLADETTRDITEMAAFAGNPGADPVLTLKLTPKAPNSYDVEAQLGGAAVATALTLRESIWSPSDYEAWAAKALSVAHVTPPQPSAVPPGWIEKLTQARPQILIAEGQRLSKALSAAPLDAALHEQAALLISCFALREAAGGFTNYRRELCRITAHLSMARALHPNAHTPLGDLAEAALATLAERHGPALAMLTKMESDQELTAWVSALRMRNTGDWRVERRNPTALELVENFRARVRNVDVNFALAWLKKQTGAPSIPDWQRIILEGGFGVEIGHSIAKTAIPQEIALLRKSWADYSGGALAEADVVKVLNQPAAQCVTKGADDRAEMRVLGWDFWAAQHQRQLCLSIESTNKFLRDLWGVDEYKDVQKFVREHYAALTLYPLVERDVSDGVTDLAPMSKRASQLALDHPELFNATIWANLNFPSQGRFPVAALRLPDPAQWIPNICPFGTAFEFAPRCYRLCNPEPNETAKWDALLALSPCQYDVRYCHVWKKYHERPPIEVAEAEMAPLTPYCLPALTYLSNLEFTDSPRYPETMERICAFSPLSYISLGNYYVMHAQPERAAAAFQKAIQLAPDRVGIANACGWYVNYLEDHGRKAEALTVAQEAAEVYSYRGLETMARLMEKRGKLKDAENYFQKIAERYDDKSELTSFYIRHTGDPMFAAISAPLKARLYPLGPEKVSVADLKTPPTDGVRMVDTTTFASNLGLRPGDIFVGFDGIRVHNVDQFKDIRMRTADPNVTYVVWNARKGYREIKAVLPARLLGVATDNWQAK